MNQDIRHTVVAPSSLLLGNSWCFQRPQGRECQIVPVGGRHFGLHRF